MTERDDVRAGRCFQHRHLLDPDWQPGADERWKDGPKAVCRITAVRRGEVFYGLGRDARKGRIVTPIDRFLVNVFDGWVE